MGIFSKDIASLDDLFVHTLRDVYYAEKQIQKSLPKLIHKAADGQLKDALSTHLDETNSQVDRLEEVFRLHGAEPKAVDCPAMDGLLKEADDVVGEVGDESVLDAAIIAAAQAVEHYEIARYGTLITWAKQLGRDDCASILATTLEQEKSADMKLTRCAEQGINAKAA